MEMHCMKILRLMAFVATSVALAAGCSSGSGTGGNPPAVTVHPANWIEVSGAPGSMGGRLQMTMSDGQSISPVLALQVITLGGTVVTPVPVIPASGVRKTSFTVARGGTMVRTVDIVVPSLGSPGMATLEALQGIAGLDTVLAPPADPARAALHAKTMMHLKQLVADLTTVIKQAQSGPVTVGAMNGALLVMDSAALETMDALVLGAQEAVVPLSATPGTSAQALTTGGILLLGTVAILLAPAEATLTTVVGSAIVGGALVGLIESTTLGLALKNAISTADPSSLPPSSASDAWEAAKEAAAAKADGLAQSVSSAAMSLSGALQQDASDVANDAQEAPPMTTCGAGETACGAACCPAGKSCADASMGQCTLCNPGDTTCGTACCTGGHMCTDPAANKCSTCNPGDTECGTACCMGGQTCCPGGQGCADLAMSACVSSTFMCDDQPMNCQGTTLPCTANAPCTVNCTGQSSCQGAVIQCPAGAPCIVTCSGQSSCESASISCSDSDPCTLLCPAPASSCPSSVSGPWGSIGSNGGSWSQVVSITCNGGNCFGVCAAGFADCNNSKSLDGCEVNLMVDHNNCGACGQACPMNKWCNNGSCS